VSSDHHLKYRADVDGLRAIAVLLVVGFHAFPGRIRGGFIGVDIFFVISGFLIGGIIMQAIEQRTFTFAWFYGRRVRRIFPALALMLAAALVAGWFLLLADEYGQLGKHVFGGTAFLSNFVLWKEAGYFDTAADSKLLLHLWSLGVEEQFYIVLPPLLLLAYRRQWKVGRLVAAIAVGSFVLNVARVGRHPIDTFFLPLTRFWELLAGTLLAYGTLTPPTRWPTGTGRRRAETLAALGLGGIAVAAAALSKASPFPGTWALLPVLATVALIAAGPEAWINRRLLSWRPVVYVGLISYPLYLWHWPALAFARIATGGATGIKARLAAVAGSFVLAVLTYHFVEKPIRTGRRAVRAKTAGLGVAMAALGALGAVVFVRDGVPSRPISQLNSRIERNLRWHYWGDDACIERFKVVPCQISAPAPEVMLLGDSHANSLYPGLTLIDRPLWVVGVGACGPFDGVDQVVDRNADKHMCTGKDYVAVNERIIDTVPSIRTVLISAYWRSYLDGHVANAHEREQWGSLNLIARLPEERQLARRDLITASVTRTIQYMRTRGKTVVFVRDVPEIADELKEYCRLNDAAQATCAIPRALFEQQRGEETALLARLKQAVPELLVFDPLPQLCDAERCYLMKDGHLFYRDGHHLSIDGSVRVGAALAALVRESSPEPFH